VLSVAKVKLSDFLQDYRRLAIHKSQSVKGEVIIELFRKEIEDDANNQPRTKLYKQGSPDRPRKGRPVVRGTRITVGYLFDGNVPSRLRFSPKLPIISLSNVGRNPSDS
jgi:hypothetical protein